MTCISSPALRTALACAVIATLSACGGSDGGSQSNTGTLKLGITDAPVDNASGVVVKFTGVELKPRDGASITIDFSNTLDLYPLQGTTRALLLDGATVPAGEYEWLRLKVDAEPNVVDSYLELTSGQQCELRIPSGAESGLKLIRGFTVGIGSVTDMTVDIDLRKSLVEPPGQRSDATTCDGQTYLLKPVLRVVDNLEVGTITGLVDASLMTGKACEASPTHAGNVYLFGPYEADPAPEVDDYDGTGDPITAAMVNRETHRYTIGFVPKGKYVIAYTCDADAATVDADTDQGAIPPPATDELVEFSPAAGVPVEVAPSQILTVDFPPTT